MSQYNSVPIGICGHWPAERRLKIPEYKRQIVEGIRSGLWISEICQQLNVGTAAVREWRSEDAEFNEHYLEAEGAFIDTIEKEAHRRAFHGVADVIVAGGRVVMDPFVADGEKPRPLLRRTFSDGLAMFILKGRRREVYGDKVETDNRHTVNLDGARETLEAKLNALAERRGAPGPAVEPD